MTTAWQNGAGKKFAERSWDVPTKEELSKEQSCIEEERTVRNTESWKKRQEKLGDDFSNYHYHRNIQGMIDCIQEGFEGFDNRNLLSNFAKRYTPTGRSVKYYDRSIDDPQSYHDKLVFVKFLLDLGVNVNGRNSDGQTALLCAAEENDLEMAKLLIKYGAIVDRAAWNSVYSDDEMSRFLFARYQLTVDSPNRKCLKTELSELSHQEALLKASKLNTILDLSTGTLGRKDRAKELWDLRSEIGFKAAMEAKKYLDKNSKADMQRLQRKKIKGELSEKSQQLDDIVKDKELFLSKLKEGDEDRREEAKRLWKIRDNKRRLPKELEEAQKKYEEAQNNLTEFMEKELETHPEIATSRPPRKKTREDMAKILEREDSVRDHVLKKALEMAGKDPETKEPIPPDPDDPRYLRLQRLHTLKEKYGKKAAILAAENLRKKDKPEDLKRKDRENLRTLLSELTKEADKIKKERQEKGTALSKATPERAEVAKKIRDLRKDRKDKAQRIDEIKEKMQQTEKDYTEAMQRIKDKGNSQ